MRIMQIEAKLFSNLNPTVHGKRACLPPLLIFSYKFFQNQAFFFQSKVDVGPCFRVGFGFGLT